MTDDDIRAMDDAAFRRGRVTVHRVLDGKVYFVSRLHDEDVWQPLWMWRETFVEAVQRAREEPDEAR